MLANPIDQPLGYIYAFLFTDFVEDPFVYRGVPSGLKLGRSGYKVYLSKKYRDYTKGVKTTGGSRLTTPDRAALVPINDVLTAIPAAFDYVNIFVRNEYVLNLLKVGWPDQLNWRAQADSADLTLPDDDVTDHLLELKKQRMGVRLARMPEGKVTHGIMGEVAALRAAEGRVRPVDRGFERESPWLTGYLKTRRRCESSAPHSHEILRSLHGHAVEPTATPGKYIIPELEWEFSWGPDH